MIITEKWIRKCDECGNKQEDTQPILGALPSDNYTYRKCNKCRSEGLEYGSTRFFNENNEEIEEDEDENGNHQWVKVQ